MRYLSVKQLLLIHSCVIDETGGIHGVRDHGSLFAAEAGPKQQAFGKFLYSTLFLKAAVYAYRIVMNHPFLDGNKRTGLTAAIIFIENNGYFFIAKQGEIERFALQIIIKNLSIFAIATWLKKHCRKKV